jgi:hypothetical protein
MPDTTERTATSFYICIFFFASAWDSNFNDFGFVLDNLVFILHILSSVVLCYFSGRYSF